MNDIVIATAGLYVVILLRAGGTYAIGRLAGAGVRRSRLSARIPQAKLQRTEDLITRWGAPVVALSFLTVGFQTAANFVAGTLRLRLSRYVPALMIGGLAWAVIYATVGIGLFEAASALLGRYPAAWWVVAALVIALAALVIRSVRRHRREPRVDNAAEAELLEHATTEPDTHSPARPQPRHLQRTVVGRIFTVVAFVEAFTWAGLLVGMFLKYGPQTTELGVRLFGPLHGAAFIAFVVLTVVAAIVHRWSWWVIVVSLASTVVPLSSIPLEIWLYRTGRLSPRPRTGRTDAPEASESAAAHAPSEAAEPR